MTDLTRSNSAATPIFRRDTMNISEINDIAGRFDISDSEAKRIAANANNEAEFIKIWENDNWWTDGNTYTTLQGESKQP